MSSAQMELFSGTKSPSHVQQVEVIPFPLAKMVGQRRMAMARIAAMPPGQRGGQFVEEVLTLRDNLRAIGVPACAMQAQAQAFAIALASELVSAGYPGAWSGWLRNGRGAA